MNDQAALLDARGGGGDGGGDDHNVTDWFLERVQSHYDRTDITKDDIWEYLYGVMHAPDWREKYRHELSRQLPRVPLADEFEAFLAFCSAGRQLMDLHAGYETAPECAEVVCMVDDEPDEGDADPQAYRIGKQMRWPRVTGEDGKATKAKDMTVLVVNERCRLEGIPAEAHEYQVSGRSPLEWAVDQLKHKDDPASGISDDPNGWHAWADDADAFELIRHLRRLAYVGTETARIVASLPPSLPAEAG